MGIFKHKYHFIVVFMLMIWKQRGVMSKERQSSDNGLLPVYHDAAQLDEGWESSSVGTDISYLGSNYSIVRTGSDFSMLVNVLPFAEFAVTMRGGDTMETVLQHGGGVLEIIDLGCGMRSANIYLDDTTNRRYTNSIDLLQLYNEMGDRGSSIRNPKGGMQTTTDGWCRTLVNLTDIVKNEKDHADWNRIVFEDVSGNGFTMVVSSIMLGASEEAISSSMPTVLDSKVPVYGSSSAGVSGITSQTYIGKLQSSTTGAEVEDMCAWLKEDGLGTCVATTRKQELSAVSIANLNESASWDFVTIKVNSPKSLDIMSSTLVDRLEYLEMDGSTRILKEEQPSSRRGRKLLSPASEWAAPEVESLNNAEFNITSRKRCEIPWKYVS